MRRVESLCIFKQKRRLVRSAGIHPLMWIGIDTLNEMRKREYV